MLVLLLEFLTYCCYCFEVYNYSKHKSKLATFRTAKYLTKASNYWYEIQYRNKIFLWIHTKIYTKILSGLFVVIKYYRMHLVILIRFFWWILKRNLDFSFQLQTCNCIWHCIHLLFCFQVNQTKSQQEWIIEISTPLLLILLEIAQHLIVFDRQGKCK